ncbi:MAG: U32 family peptidase [Deltaproteobacteria bacterium]|nr:U32 family peptidase [Deltaproteobacteria bacterium]
MRRPEILAPAGDQAALDAALGAGADAIYFGLDEGFNARARAANFPLTGLADTVAKIHRAGARAYVAFNTLVFEQELPVVGELLHAIAAAGVDAIIVQDPAVALMARAVCPALEVHGSTQMTASSPAAAELVRELGLTRVVVPRELSVDEIRQYKAGTSLELEVFIHGALCVSWSGQCLTSEAWGGRSANRGQCAQSCRLPYDLIVDGEVRDLGDVKYLLSPQDLAGIDSVPALAAIGVASLKIEGRQKAPDYVATAVAGYRRWVDGLVSGAPDHAQRDRDLAAMEVAYSRGFSPGFLGGADHQHLVAGRFPKHRGAYLGRVIRIRGDEVLVLPHPDDRAPGLAPIAGAGIGFDGGRPEADEPGGPLFRVDPFEQDGVRGWRLGFGRPGPDLGQVAIGDRVWMSGSPEVKRAADRDGGAATDGRNPIAVRVRGAVGEPLVVEAWPVAREAKLVTATSAMALTAARGAGLDRALVADKLGALGGTPFAIATLDDSALAPGLHLPVSELKAMRRALVAALERDLATVDRVIAAAPSAADLRARFPVVAAPVAAAAIVPLCRTDAQLDAALELGCDEIELDWMELVGLAKAAARVRAAGARAVVATVRIQKPGEDRIDAHLARIAADGPGGILVRSWGALATYRALPEAQRPVLHGDFSLNVTNSVTAAWALSQGLATLTAAHDLDAVQLEALIAAAPRGRIAVTAHHHIPTFHTEHCVYAHLLSSGKDYKTCGRPCEAHEVALRDRTGLPHPVIVDVGCRNTVFGAQAQSAPGLAARLVERGVTRLRIELVRESGAEAARVIGAWRALVAGSIGPAEVLARLRLHERFGVTAGTMKTLAVLR